MNYICKYDSCFGEIILSSHGEAVTGLWFKNQKHFPSDTKQLTEQIDLPIFKQVISWLDIYFSGNNPGFVPKMELITTPLRKMVCEIMLGIPYGQTTTYKAIAQNIARQRKIPTFSCQAVGQAVGHNPISIIIPCHRVLASDGSLRGYAGGLDRKQKLLLLEGIVCDK